MTTILLGLVALVLGVYFLMRPRSPAGPARGALDLLFGFPSAIVLVVSGLVILGQTSFVYVPADQVGHLRRLYFADDLPPVHVVALSGQKGPQAEILGPGFHFSPLMKVLYDVELFP